MAPKRASGKPLPSASERAQEYANKKRLLQAAKAKRLQEVAAAQDAPRPSGERSPEAKRARTEEPTQPPTRVVDAKAPALGVADMRAKALEEGGSGSRNNYDRQSVRIIHSETYRKSISQNDLASRCPPAKVFGRNVELYIRKRPLLTHEAQRGDFDCVSVSQGNGRTVVHNCQEKMRKRLIRHSAFPATSAFGEEAENDQVYAGTLQPLLASVVEEGAAVTVLMFGQTGSGKTHTMEALQSMAIDGLFALIGDGKRAAAQDGSACLRLSIVEVQGKAGRDLLEGGEVQFMEASPGKFHWHGAKEVGVAGPQEFMGLLSEAGKRRSTCQTSANATSSRSHCAVRVRVEGGGSLLLVDCAGTERSEESALHDRDRRRESAAINTSLYALKECMRARRAGEQSEGGGKHVPYRQDTLTKLLQETFEESHLMVIATVSPTASSTEHSLLTLRTVCEFLDCSKLVVEETEVCDEKKGAMRAEERRLLMN